MRHASSPSHPDTSLQDGEIKQLLATVNNGNRLANAERVPAQGTRRSGTGDVSYEALAGLGSDLYKRYRVYLQYVGIVTPPCDYAERLQRMFSGAQWTKLQLFALDPVDLALSKLERNSDRDREDVLRLAQAGYVDCGVLKARYLEEVRPYLLHQHEWHDQILELRIKMISESSSNTPMAPIMSPRRIRASQ